MEESNLLVIDKSVAMQKVVELALKKSNLNQLFKADSLVAARPILQQNNIAAVVMDAEFIKSFQNLLAELNLKDTPRIYLLCGSTLKLDTAELRLQGADEVLQKPFHPSELKDRVDQYFAKFAKPQAIAQAQPAKEVTNEEAILNNPKAAIQQKTQTERKGRKAFQADSDTHAESLVADQELSKSKPEVAKPKPTVKQSVQKAASSKPTETPHRVGGASQQDIAAEIENAVSGRLAALVKKEVQAYCKEHFDDLARSVVEVELRRLAMERTRHLVDN